MLIFLSITIIALMIYSYMITRRIFSPPCIACLSMGGASLIGVCNMNYWGFDIHFETTMLILLGLSLFIAGYLAGGKIKKYKKIANDDDRCFVIKKKYIFIFICIASMAIYGFYLEMNQHLWLMSMSIEDDYALQKLHEAGRGSFDYSWYIKYPLAVVQVITVVCLYCFIYNITHFGFRFQDVAFFVPIPFYIMNSIFRTNRNEILLLILLAVNMYLFLSKRIKFKSIIYSCILIFGFIIWFGIFRMIKTGNYDIQITIDSICVYLAGGIPALDKIVIGDLGFTINEFGGRTLRLLYVFLGKLGVSYNEQFIMPYAGDGFAYIGSQITSYGLGVSTNVFTAFGTIYIDFGYLGIISYFLIYGLILGFFERYVFSKDEGYRYIIYAYLLYPVYVFNFDDVLILMMINPARVLEWVVGYYVYRFMNNRRVKMV